MDLALTEDQESIRDVFADFFSSETGPEQAREAEPLGFDSRAWDRLLETGAPGMGVAESSGGGGANLADLAVVVEEAVPAEQLVAEIRAVEPNLIESVHLFDVYAGDQVAAQHKSLAFSLRLRSGERTLEDREADAVVKRVLSRLQQRFDARLRE